MVSPDSVKKPRKRASSVGLSSDDLSVVLSVVFGLAAKTRGEHWAKTPEECTAVGVPLHQILENQPKHIQKKVNSMALPVALLLGVGSLLAEPVKVELENYERIRRAKSGGKGDANRQAQTPIDTREANVSLSNQGNGSGNVHDRFAAALGVPDELGFDS